MAQEPEDVMPLVPLQTFPLWLDVTGDAQSHKATLRSPQTQSAETYIYTYYSLRIICMNMETTANECNACLT
jgi:hypothetical protein